MGRMPFVLEDRLIVAKHEMPGPKGVPQRGWRTQPRVSTLNRRPERFALKGRQIERPNNAKVGPVAALSILALMALKPWAESSWSFPLQDRTGTMLLLILRNNELKTLNISLLQP
jgi:hypothetical protein